MFQALGFRAPPLRACQPAWESRRLGMLPLSHEGSCRACALGFHRYIMRRAPFLAPSFGNGEAQKHASLTPISGLSIHRHEGMTRKNMPVPAVWLRSGPSRSDACLSLARGPGPLGRLLAQSTWASEAAEPAKPAWLFGGFGLLRPSGLSARCTSGKARGPKGESAALLCSVQVLPQIGWRRDAIIRSWVRCFLTSIGPPAFAGRSAAMPALAEAGIGDLRPWLATGAAD